MRLSKHDQELLAEAYEQVSNPESRDAHKDKLNRLILFAKGISGHYLPKYKDALQHFAGLDDIRSDQHGEGIVSAMIQIAQDPDSNKSQSSGYNTKEQIEEFLKRFYPARVKEIGADMSKAKGGLGAAGVYY